MPTVRTGPLTGLAGQLVLLAALALTTGLGVAGWIAGTVYGTVVCGVLSWGLHSSGARSLGPADRVTLVRAGLAGGVTALTVDSFTRAVPVAVMIGLATVALMLDAVDGYVARQTGTASAFGARFDMEVDAFLILVLSVYVAQGLGAWVLLIGVMRYAYWLATWLVGWLRGPLPPRYWRKVVAAIQGIVLGVAAAGVLPRPMTIAAVMAALALLVESFGRDVWWRWQDRPALAVHAHAWERQHESV